MVAGSCAIVVWFFLLLLFSLLLSDVRSRALYAVTLHLFNANDVIESFCGGVIFAPKVVSVLFVVAFLYIVV